MADFIWRHKNVDYSICQAVSYKSQDMPRAIIIYDVACQWHKNFSTRINNCAALSWPEEIEITPAIGKFHLSAHKPYCFPRFSLMFLKRDRSCGWGDPGNPLGFLQQNFPFCEICYARCTLPLYYLPRPGDRTPNLTMITVTTNYYTPYPM